MLLLFLLLLSDFCKTATLALFGFMKPTLFPGALLPECLESTVGNVSLLLSNCKLLTEGYCLPQSEIGMNQTAKISSSETPDAETLSQDGTPLSEMDKAAVLTLIREEVCCREKAKNK